MITNSSDSLATRSSNSCPSFTNNIIRKIFVNNILVLGFTALTLFVLFNFIGRRIIIFSEDTINYYIDDQNINATAKAVCEYVIKEDPCNPHLPEQLKWFGNKIIKVLDGLPIIAIKSIIIGISIFGFCCSLYSTILHNFVSPATTKIQNKLLTWRARNNFESERLLANNFVDSIDSISPARNTI